MSLTPQEARIVRTIGQTLFPRDAVIDLDAEDVRVTDYMEDYFARVPSFQRGQLRALIAAVDYGFAAWSRRPTARFTEADPEERRQYLESWARASTYTQRMVFEGLKVMFTFAYVDAQAVKDRIGVTEVPLPMRDAQELS